MTTLTYMLALLPFVLLFFGDPIIEFMSENICTQQSTAAAGLKKIQRLPRPNNLNFDLLAVEEEKDKVNGTSKTSSSYQCREEGEGGAGYKVYVYSREPLVMYFERFLSPDERRHLMEISEPLYEPSTVTHNGGANFNRDTSVRDSEVAMIPRDGVVRCVEDRARSVQGWRDEVWIERLRMQRYRTGGHYSHHYDWSSSSMGGWGRVSSFMVWVDASDGIEGGGTEFPLLRKRGDARWCKFVECKEEEDEKGEAGGSEKKGVVFKPVAGNAVYWENFRSDGTGRGFEETWHAGLPVIKGVKVGLNIWSWGRMD